MNFSPYCSALILLCLTRLSADEVNGSSDLLNSAQESLRKVPDCKFEYDYRRGSDWVSTITFTKFGDRFRHVEVVDGEIWRILTYDGISFYRFEARTDSLEITSGRHLDKSRFEQAFRYNPVYGPLSWLFDTSLDEYHIPYFFSSSYLATCLSRVKLEPIIDVGGGADPTGQIRIIWPHDQRELKLRNIPGFGSIPIAVNQKNGSASGLWEVSELISIETPLGKTALPLGFKEKWDIDEKRLESSGIRSPNYSVEMKKESFEVLVVAPPVEEFQIPPTIASNLYDLDIIE